jgi:dissimilatory sulfite reductase (desulfoviridin) alpha/beta subunit
VPGVALLVEPGVERFGVVGEGIQVCSTGFVGLATDQFQHFDCPEARLVCRGPGSRDLGLIGVREHAQVGIDLVPASQRGAVVDEEPALPVVVGDAVSVDDVLEHRSADHLGLVGPPATKQLGCRAAAAVSSSKEGQDDRLGAVVGGSGHPVLMVLGKPLAEVKDIIDRGDRAGPLIVARWWTSKSRQGAAKLLDRCVRAFRCRDGMSGSAP